MVLLGPLILGGALGVYHFKASQLKKYYKTCKPWEYPSERPGQDLEGEEVTQILENQEKERAELIAAQIAQMAWEIKASQAGRGILIMQGHEVRNSHYGATNSTEISHAIGIKSTFPHWFSELKFKSKADFFKCYENGLAGRKFKRWKRLEAKAVERLTYGYQNAHGYDDPHPLFQELGF